MRSYQWSFLANPFDTATKTSYKKAVGISTFHLNALTAQAAAVPVAAVLLTSYAPLHAQLLTAYQSWQSHGGTQEGDSLSLTQLLALLSGTRINDWDVAIQSVYNKNTPQYKALLPDRRVPFQNGSQQERINAVKNLRDKTAADPALAALSPAVATYYTQLLAAFDTQKLSLRTTDAGSDAVEAARVAMCIGQYGDLGALMHQYAATPEAIDGYFDLASIRTHDQAKFSGSHLAAGASHLVVQHTFAPGDTLRLRNVGARSLAFYLGATAAAAVPASTFVLQAGEDKVVEATALGDTANAYVIVHNQDAALDGSWKVDIL